MKTNYIYIGDVTEVLKGLPDKSIQMCVTSPPYFALRDYGVDGQLGLEDTPEAFVEAMVAVFSQVKRVLKDDGTLWLNIGDSYAGSGKGGHSDRMRSKNWAPNLPADGKNYGLKPKDLIGIPWMLAFALRADGWYLRQDIIWSKPNPMPESVKDRPTKAHEYIFLLSKQPRYYYNSNAIRTIPKAPTTKMPDGWDTGIGDHGSFHRNGREKGEKLDKQRGHGRHHAGFNDRWDQMSKEEQQSLGSNKRSVWEVATHPYKEAHFATFPPKLIEPCILAGSKEDDVVLDPFLGSGTTAVVALRAGRKFVGIEINPEYAKLAEERIRPHRNQLFQQHG